MHKPNFALAIVLASVGIPTTRSIHEVAGIVRSAFVPLVSVRTSNGLCGRGEPADQATLRDPPMTAGGDPVICSLAAVDRHLV